MKKIVLLLATIGILAVSTRVNAAPTNQAEFDALMDEFGVLTSYRAVAPAEPLGILGFDISLEGTSGTYEGNDVVLPKIKIQKGLIAGLDLSGYYTSVSVPGVSASANGYGVALTYAILDGSTVAPAWNIRGSYTALDVPGVLRSTTTGFDTSISKGLGPITPYVGLGMINLGGSDQTGIGFTDYSASKTRYYYGLSFDLLAFNLTIEGANTDGVNSYSAKIGFRIGD